MSQAGASDESPGPSPDRVERILARLVSAYPVRFRERFGTDLLALHRSERARVGREQGRWGVRWLDARTLLGVVLGVVREWIHEMRAPSGGGHTAGPGASGPHRGGGEMVGWIETLWTELRLAARALRRSPGFAATVVATLGLGVGANTAMFEVVDQLLLRPPPLLKQADQVHTLYFHRTRSGNRRINGSFSYPGFRDVTESVEGFDAVVASAWREQIGVLGDQRRKLLVLAMSGAGWSMFDAVPAAGRLFGPADDELPLGRAVAVLSWGFWQREYGGDPSVVGGTLDVAEKRYEIVGVAPRSFRAFELRTPDVFVPLTAAAPTFVGDDFAERAGTTFLTVRVRPSSPETASAAELSATRAIEAHYATSIGEDAASEWNIEADFQPLQAARGPYPRDEARFTLWLLAMAGIVFLVACANVATLMTGRALRRRRETAVRSALGIRSGRLLMVPLMESVLLAVVGGLLAIPIGHAAVVGVTRTLLPNATELTGLEPRSMIFGAGLLLVAGAVVSLLPILQTRRSDLATVLRSGGRGAGVSRSRAQTLLPVGQAALSTVLLVGAGLFVRSVTTAASVDLGFDPEPVALVDIETSGAFDMFRAGDELGFSMDELAERAAGVPGVRGVARATSTPFLNTSSVSLMLEDGSSAPGSEGTGGGTTTGMSTGQDIEYLETMVSPEYFDVMGTAILEGRALRPGDTEGAEPVIVVSRSVARTVWPAPGGPGTAPSDSARMCGRTRSPATGWWVWRPTSGAETSAATTCA